jgi:hypothetical protein
MNIRENNFVSYKDGVMVFNFINISKHQIDQLIQYSEKSGSCPNYRCSGCVFNTINGCASINVIKTLNSIEKFLFSLKLNII